MRSTVAAGIGLRRLQHIVLWVSDVGRSVRFYRDVLGFEVKADLGKAVFLKIPGTPDDHHLGSEPRQELRAARPRFVLGQVQDSDPVERVRHGLSSGEPCDGRGSNIHDRGRAA